MIRIGAIVRTNYDTGPYRITEVHGPCTCPAYLAHIDGDDTPSEPHYHLICAYADRPGKAYLCGYRLDGTSVWDDDRLIFDGMAVGVTADLFDPADHIADANKMVRP